MDLANMLQRYLDEAVAAKLSDLHEAAIAAERAMHDLRVAIASTKRRRRGRPPGSKSKKMLSADSKPQRRRGRPPGSKNKVKTHTDDQIVPTKPNKPDAPPSGISMWRENGDLD